MEFEDWQYQSVILVDHIKKPKISASLCDQLITKISKFITEIGATYLSAAFGTLVVTNYFIFCLVGRDYLTLLSL